MVPLPSIRSTPDPSSNVAPMEEWGTGVPSGAFFKLNSKSSVNEDDNEEDIEEDVEGDDKEDVEEDDKEDDKEDGEEDNDEEAEEDNDEEKGFRLRMKWKFFIQNKALYFISITFILTFL